MISVVLREMGPHYLGVFSSSLFYTAVSDNGGNMAAHPLPVIQSFPNSQGLTEILESVRYSTVSHLYSRVRTRPCTLQTEEHRLGATSQQHEGSRVGECIRAG